MTTTTLNIRWRRAWRYALRTGTKRITGDHAAHAARLGWLKVYDCHSWRGFRCFELEW